MSACKYYNTEGYHRCALKLHKPCHECGQFAPADHGVEFEITDNTVIGPDSDPNRGANRATKGAWWNGMYAGVAKPTVDTVIPDSDAVHSPAHYKGHYPAEVKELIEICLNCCNAEEKLSPWEAYCLGNELKYRLRAGLKGDAAQDIAKALEYATFRKEG